ncbi:menaquinone biosynthesis family protein [Aliarcobacter cryaerophilus]|uniref:menaquinone biosynthesis family protein n=1 Tax=Aliarcobacter cryaerophilus TaxID=28198 RepID=UPI001654A37F|nr:MqnA/MqnD/SBP family protein [Aliarcobacter cryaerophilus]QNM92419.1 succinate--CoA ligase [Aliarcobacter cryaerophilus]
MRTISVGHSPDADDIFMYYAIKFGWVGIENTKFENIALDIETLNQATLKGIYDICAISFALYPFVKDDFALLKTAVSFGEGYGPKLIKKKGTKLKKNFKVALSGEFTTNALVFKIAYPEAKISYMNFLDIENAVIEGTVDAGVLIHESILTYSSVLEVEREIWDIWVELCEGEELPLPLGGMCLRRSIPLHEAIKYENALIKAVDVANKNRKTLAPMLLEKGLIRVDATTLDKYLDLYANDNSVKMSQIQYKALNKLFELGYKSGHYQNLIKAEDFLIPSEYEELRAR